MTKFSGTFSGQTDGPDVRKLGAAVLVAGAGVVAWKALGSAASTLGELIVIVPVALGSLAVGAVVTYVVLRARRPRQPASAGRPAEAALWTARADALPPREVKAIAPVPVVNVNIGADFLAGLAGLMNTAQQPAASVIVQSEQQELPR